jgi:hypothetical protein
MGSAAIAQWHADVYRALIPEWPALWQSFAREARRLAGGKA